ncbi:unnamed protein product [marine sediment metagenome]|uniref:Putative phage metallopeptidase domain-containing protein n=1 Tax=marine sediment metagenome TaxID=412755 RepID=X0T6Y5_9ZZZZ
MSSKLWQAEKEVMDTVQSLIAQHHPHLAVCDNEIAVVFKEKASKAGDAVVAGKSAKAPELLGVLGETDWKFIITLGADVWVNLDDKEKLALLDHHLCACRVDEKPDNPGEYKFFIQPPDVAFYREEVERHGFWRKGEVASTPPDKTLVEKLFGPEN